MAQMSSSTRNKISGEKRNTIGSHLKCRELFVLPRHHFGGCRDARQTSSFPHSTHISNLLLHASFQFSAAPTSLDCCVYVLLYSHPVVCGTVHNCIALASRTVSCSEKIDDGLGRPRKEVQGDDGSGKRCFFQ